MSGINKYALWLVIAINFFAGLYGIYYYTIETHQFDGWPIYMWPFIPDSAIAVLLCVVVLSGVIKSELLDYITSIYLVKYGLFTVFVMTLYGDVYLAPEIALTSIFLFIIPHIGMVVEAILTIPRKVNENQLAIMLCFMMFHDSIDYFLGTHTRIPLEQIHLVTVFSFAVSIILCFGIAKYNEEIISNKSVAKVRKFFNQA